MLRVLIVYHSGASPNARCIFQALATNRSLSLTVIAPARIQTDPVYAPDGWLPLPAKESDAGYDLIPIALRDATDYRRGFEPGPLREWIVRLKPDIIHVFDEVTSTYLRQIAWMRLTAAPQAKVLFYGFNNLPVSFRRRLEGRFFWPLLAGGAVASTGALHTVRHDGFSKQRPVERIFWGISTAVFHPLDRGGLEQEFGLEPATRVGYVGRLVPSKGMRIFREAFEQLPDHQHGLIIGSGPLRDEMQQWAGSAGRKGRLTLRESLPPAELVKYLNCMDVLVLPSLTTPEWKEQYGRVLAEAMACGVPVIGSDSGAIPEVISPAGLIVPEGDASALAAALQKLLGNDQLRADLKSLARQRAETELSANAMARNLADFYSRFTA
jgi:glycosyltransferase involved in cell wall biosynthesis